MNQSDSIGLYDDAANKYIRERCIAMAIKWLSTEEDNDYNTSDVIRVANRFSDFIIGAKVDKSDGD